MKEEEGGTERERVGKGKRGEGEMTQVGRG